MSRALVILALALLAAAGLVLDSRDLAPAAPTAPSPRAASRSQDGALPTSGRWYCAATPPEGVLHLTVATPPTDDPEGAGIDVAAFRDGDEVPAGDATPSDLQVFSTGVRVRDLAGTEGLGIDVRWRQVPAVVAREWTRSPAGAPETVVSGPCSATPARSWVVPGLSTDAGSTARLAIANPFVNDATVAVTLATPEGPLAPRLLENLVVPGRSVLTVDIGEHAPERPDVGAVVTARTGRVVVEAVQAAVAAVAGPEGASLVRATPAVATSWTVPWFDAGPTATSWAWVTNPGEAPATVTVTLHAGTGGTVPEGAGEVRVPAGSVRRIPLSDLVAADQRGAGVSVRSVDGTPVAVAVGTRYAPRQVARGGFAVQLGAPAPDDSWVLLTAATGRRARLHLVNPGGAPAAVDVVVRVGTTIVERPRLLDIEVPPGAAIVRDVSPAVAGDLPGAALFIAADGSPIVAALTVDAAQGDRRLAVVAGVPSSAWRPVAAPLEVRHVDGLAARLDLQAAGDETDPDLGPELVPTERPLEVVTAPPSPTVGPTGPPPPTAG